MLPWPVGRWRDRYAASGLAGIKKDLPRSGRKPEAREKLAAEIIRKTTMEKSKNAAYWSTRTLTKELGTSHVMVVRVWKAATFAHSFTTILRTAPEYSTGGP